MVWKIREEFKEFQQTSGNSHRRQIFKQPSEINFSICSARKMKRKMKKVFNDLIVTQLYCIQYSGTCLTCFARETVSVENFVSSRNGGINYGVQSYINSD